MTLDIRDLSFSYGDVRALADVSLELASSQMVALIGANGAGKTTLLKTIAGLLKPDAGTIRLKGEVITHLPANEVLKRGVALVPEGRRLFQGMTVTENLRMGAYARRHNNTQLDRVLEIFPVLSERGNQLAGTLSGGEQQMCAIGRAIMSEPEVLLIDELSLGLAPVVVDQLMSLLQQVQVEENLTLLLVEQDAELALSSTQWGYVLENGRIVLSGPSPELRGNPQVQEAYLGLA